MIKLHQGRTVFIDVDETCILWSPEKHQHTEDQLIVIEDNNQRFEFLPHFKHIEFIRKLKLQGYGIIVWSRAGGQWATKVIEKLKLDDVVDLTVGKPEFVLDDLKSQKEIIGQILYIHPETGEFERN